MYHKIHYFCTSRLHSSVSPYPSSPPLILLKQKGSAAAEPAAADCCKPTRSQYFALYGTGKNTTLHCTGCPKGHDSSRNDNRKQPRELGTCISSVKARIMGGLYTNRFGVSVFPVCGRSRDGLLICQIQ